MEIRKDELYSYFIRVVSYGINPTTLNRYANGWETRFVLHDRRVFIVDGLVTEKEGVYNFNEGNILHTNILGINENFDIENSRIYTSTHP